jgi:phosphate transport system substrate-binding protein
LAFFSAPLTFAGSIDGGKTHADKLARFAWPPPTRWAQSRSYRCLSGELGAGGDLHTEFILAAAHPQNGWTSVRYDDGDGQPPYSVDHLLLECLTMKLTLHTRFTAFCQATIPLAFVVMASAFGTAQAADREQIRIVGSSTVYPFSSAVAEEFGKTTRFQTPVVESTGSGGGHKLFGAGVGLTTPDITNSSRKMKVSEFERAQANGVKTITEAVIGYDGIAVAQNIDNEPVNLTLRDITLAVAAEVPDPAGGEKLVKNPYKFWDEINNELPHRAIKIYGPPTTSGTRDAFQELCMEAATADMPAYGEKYAKVRQDGIWVDSGENDNLIVQKLTQDTNAFGVFGFSFLEENRDKIRGATIGGVEPNFDSISSGDYPLSRSLFFYIKSDHMRAVPGLYDYVKLFMDEKMIGEKGYLTKIGLVPLPKDMREASRQRVMKLKYLTLQDGELSSLMDYATANGFVKQ